MFGAVLIKCLILHLKLNELALFAALKRKKEGNHVSCKASKHLFGLFCRTFVKRIVFDEA